MLSRLQQFISQKSTRPTPIRLASRCSTRYPARRRNLAAAIENLESRQLLAAGGLDPTFGDGGIVTTNMGPAIPTDDYADNVSVQQPDGKIVVAGRLQDPLHGFGLVVTRYLPNGSLDTSFDDDGKYTDFQTGISSVYGMDLQSNGNIIVSGYNRITRITANGSLDESFGNSGVLVNAVSNMNIQDLKITANDEIVIGGFQYIDSNLRSDLAVARVDSNGVGLVGDFGTGGVVTQGFGAGYDERGREVAIGSDGSIYLAGESFDRLGDSSSSQYRDYAAMKLSDQGDIIWTSRVDGGSPNETTLAASVDGQGRLVIGGAGSHFTALRLTSAGQLDNTFGGGVVFTPFGNYQSKVSDLLVEPDGSVLMTGWSYSPSSQYDFAMAKYQSSGILDPGFGDGGQLEIDFNGRRDFVTGLAVQVDGSFVAAGFSQDPSASTSNSDFALTRVTSSGQLDSSFGVGGIVLTDIGSETLSDDLGLVVVQQPDGKVLVAGQARNEQSLGFGIARYLTDGSLDPSFGNNGKVYISDYGVTYVQGMDLQSDGKILVAGFGHIVRLTDQGSVDTTFGTGGVMRPALDIRALSIDANDRIVIGGDVYQSQTLRTDIRITRYKSDGSGLDTSFATGGAIDVGFGDGRYDYGRDLVIGDDGSIYVGGHTRADVFSPTNEYDDHVAVKLTADGELVWSRRIEGGQRFDSGRTIDVDSQDRLVILGPSSQNVVRLLANGNLDSDFVTAHSENPGPSFSAADVAIDSQDGIVIVGISFDPITRADFAVTKFDSDGTIDSGFGNGGTITYDLGGGMDFAQGVTIQTDGKILVTGSTEDISEGFTSYNDDFALVRLTVNAAPQVFDLDASAGEDGPAISISAIFNDETGNTHTFSIDAWATLGSVTNNADGTFSYDPAGVFESLAAGETASDSFTYTVTDNHGASATGTATIEIDGQNDAPIALNDLINATEDGSIVTTAVLVDDVDDDDDAASLAITIVSLPNAGTASVNADGTLSFDPGNEFQQLAAGETKQVSFEFSAVDSQGEVSNAGTVTVIVTGVNDAPYVFNLDPTANEDGPAISIPAIFNDELGDTHTFSVDTTGTLGSVTNNGNGTFSYEPSGVFESLAAAETANDSFTYTVTDNHGASATGTVFLTINGQNDAPVALNDSINADEDGSIVTTSVLVDDVDSDDNATSLAITIDAQPIAGTASVNADGTLSFDPGNDFQQLAEGETQQVSFAFSAVDAHGTISNTGTVTVTVTGANDAPFVFNLDSTVSENGPATSISAIFNDENGDTHTFSIDSSATLGTVTNNADGTFSYDPGGVFESLAVGETAYDRFTYTVTDNHGASGTGTVFLAIEGQNDAPVALEDSISATEDGDIVTTSVLVDDVDNDDDAASLVVTIGTHPTVGTASVNAVGTLSFDPAGDFQYLAVGETEQVSFEYFATDVHGAISDTATVTVTVTGVNDAPLPINDAYQTAEDAKLVIDAANGLLANDTDIDSTDTLSVVSVNGISASNGTPVELEHGVIIVSADGSFVYEAGIANDVAGETEIISYSVSDGNGGLESAVVTIDIVPALAEDSYTFQDGILRINGTNDDDSIVLRDIDGTLHLNGADIGITVSDIDEIKIWSRDGNDHIDLAGLSVASIVHAGDGNDEVTGGTATDTVFGGLGNDKLTGASGNDFLVGGLGADRIVGSSGHDILVADDISPTASRDVLDEILDSWVAQAVELEETELTDEVFADGETDKLTGGSGSDWFLVGDDDRITDLKKKNKDGDFVSTLL